MCAIGETSTAHCETLQTEIRVSAYVNKRCSSEDLSMHKDQIRIYLA